MTIADTHPVAPHPLAPTSSLLQRSLTSLRAYIGETDALSIRGVAAFTIHHAVETLRRAGLGNAAIDILEAEIEDLRLASTPRAEMARLAATVAADKGLRLIDGGRR